MSEATEGPLRQGVGLHSTAFQAMACTNKIIAGGGDPVQVRQAIELAAREVLRIERKYSRYRNDEDSIVFRINRAAGTPERIFCDPETRELINLAGKLYAMSDGLFDITSGVLRRAWDFSRAQLPEASVLEPLLHLVSWPRVEFDGDSVSLPDAGMEIDFGGFGKEYAADRAADVLLKSGITTGYVNLGGDIRIVGPKSDGEDWRFGIGDPQRKGAVIANVALPAGALATSGDYEKFVKIAGRTYCHILKPATGYPVNCWHSVSVVGVSAVHAGALSTIAMLKEQDAPAFLVSAKCRYLLVDQEGQVLTNTNT